MISVIRMDNSFIELLKDKKEIKISNLIFCYEQLEILGSSIIIYIGDKNNEVLISSSTDCNPINKDMAMYVLFHSDNNKSAFVLSEGGWQLLQPHISYGIVDTDMSVKFNKIFYTSE